MSYQVLARKWRPKTFNELMGQEHVVTVLSNALQQQRLHHAYLFTGTRGVGKTTIARIFAKSLNCLQGISVEPCGQCDACLDIDQGRFVDLLEIDAASKTKVDDTREILDNVQYAPTRGRYKVYLIDEVHMLSRSSFNALLKTLEEPPEHVKFILATTDPQKLPVTVLSRCLQFHLKALSVPQIERQLQTILSAEDITFEDLAITLLAKAARGSMRDSLSLTDQAIAQGQGNISSNNVQLMLGGVDHHWVYKILILLIKQDSKALMTLSLEIASFAPNYGRLMAELIQLLHQIAMNQVVEKHFDLSPEHNILLEKFCRAMSPEDVQLYYQIVLNGRKDLPYCADEQAAFDMVLLRLLAFKPQTTALAVDESQNLVSTIDFDDIALPSSLESNEKVKLEGDKDNLQPQAPAMNLPHHPIAEAENNAEADNNAIDHTNSNSALLENENHEMEQVLAQELFEIENSAQHAFIATNDTQSLPLGQEELQNQPIEGYAEHHQENDENHFDGKAPESALVDIGPSISEEALVSRSNESFQVNEQNNLNVAEEQSQDLVESQQYQEATSAPSSAQTTVPDQPMVNSPIESIIAGRNMLRSRKKSLETAGKKPNDALKRQQPKEESALKSKNEHVPDISTISEQPYSPDIIDPTVIKHANQVDKWANMIDAMSLNGRLRQLALNATIDEASSDDLLILLLNQSTKHLKSDVAHQQLQQFVSDYFEKPMQVDIKIVEATIDDPRQIQGHINDKRQEYARELLLNDEIVLALQNEFQAQLDENSISAR